MEKATFAAGCFWGVEAEFRKLKGVVSTTVGYTGGDFPDPTYFDVCTGATGHAEAVSVEFDEAVISYDQLLEAFWQMHDPAQLNRQGSDVGPQYRSAIFFHTQKQQATALEAKAELDSSGRYSRPLATEIVPATDFYEAEDYHQRYFEKNRRAASCR